MFAVEQGHFVARYLKSHIEWGHKSASVALTPEQSEALQLFEDVTEDPAFFLEKPFHPGDMQFANNLKVFHAHTAFTDHDDSGMKRHLLRLWLAPPNSPPLPQSFKAYYREIGAGAVRGGNQAWPGTTFQTTKTV